MLHGELNWSDQERLLITFSMIGLAIPERLHINSFRKPIEDCTRDELWRGQLDMQLARLDDLTGKLESLETKLSEFAAEHPDIVRLRKLATPKPTRFPSCWKVCAESLLRC